MRKLISVGMALCIFAVLFVSSASACFPGEPGCTAVTPIKITPVYTPIWATGSTSSSGAQASGATFPSPVCSDFTVQAGTANVNGGTVGFASGASSGYAATQGSAISSTTTHYF